jgi:hypothetical protein
MKKYIVLILFFKSFLFSFGQNCESIYQDELKFKEIYDYLGSHKFPYTINGNNYQVNAFAYPPNNYIYPNDADEAEQQFDNLESVGNILESLIRMYEITHDKAYLIKAINKSIQLMNARGGATAPDQYAWASGFNV